MSVKIQLSKKKQTDEQFIQLPISMDFSPLDRTDAINRDFVDVEVKKAINETVDAEVSKLKLTNLGSSILLNPVSQLMVNVSLNIDGLNTDTFLSDIGITSDDMKYQRNKLIKSFLRIELFDSPNIKTQTKITEFTMFLQMLDEYYDKSNNIFLNPKEPSVCRLKFKAYNPTKYLNNVGEGFNIFIPKKYIGTTANKNKVYARFSFNSASTGISHKLCVSKNALPISDLLTKLHVIYQTYQTDLGDLFYGIELDGIGSINLNGICEINLFECISI